MHRFAVKVQKFSGEGGYWVWAIAPPFGATVLRASLGLIVPVLRNDH